MDDIKFKNEIIKVLNEFGVNTFRGSFKHPNKDAYVEIDLMRNEAIFIQKEDGSIVAAHSGFYKI